MSDTAYKHFGLPQGYREGPQSEAYLSEEVLTKFLDSDGLGDSYSESLLAESEKMFDEADKIFQNGRDGNEMGDKFSFAAVLYAISLFFAGIASVLKTNIRWVVLGAGAARFVGSSLFVLTLKWLPVM